MTLSNSTVSGNRTSGRYAHGGGISTSSADLTNSTVSGNSTSGDRADGGGIFAFITFTSTNTTVSGNSASGVGGGIAVFTTALSNLPPTISNSILAGNFQNATATTFGTPNDLVPALFAPSITINHSLIGVADDLGLIVGDVGNLTGTAGQPLDPRLGPLADNGGPTQTYALLTGQPCDRRG